jgi:hypothetical protein
MNETAQRLTNLFECGRLVEKELGPQSQTNLTVLGIGKVRENDNDGSHPVPLHAVQDINTASTRHTDVEDNDIGVQIADKLRGLRPAARLSNNFDTADLSQHRLQWSNENIGIVRN